MNTAVEGLEINQDELEALKKRYGRVFRGRIAVKEPGGGNHEVVFLMRQPQQKDAEVMGKKSRENPVLADRSLLSSLVVYPRRAEVMAAVTHDSLSISKFLAEHALPFLGSDAEVDLTEI